MRRIPGAILIFSLFALPAWPEPIRVTGRIVQLEAPGARIELRRIPQGTEDPAPSPVTARPTADGFFELMAPGPGLYRLTAQAEGFLLSEVIPVLEETAVPVRMPSAAPGARRSASPMAVEIRKGRVLDSITQAPLPGALVWQAGLDAGEDVPWTWTAADGSFRIAVRGPDPLVGAAAAGHEPLSGSSLGSGGSSNLMLRPAVTLAGQVVDPEGRPAAGASVTAYPTEPDWILRPEARATRAGAAGRFLLNGLPQERAHRLFVQAKGFVPTWRETALGKPGQGAPPVRIVLSPGVVFTGRIVDPDGRPIAGADLALSTAADGLEETGASMSSEMKASSETSGRFRFEHVGKGAWSLQVTSPGFAPAFRSGTAGTNPRGVVDIGDLTLEPGAAIEGRVTDRRGTPLEGAEVVVSGMNSEWMLIMAPQEGPALTGPDGTFRIVDLESGRRFHLSVRKPGYVPARLPGVEAPTQEPQHIELRPARSLSGRVLDAERRPVDGARIALIEIRESGVGTNSSVGRWTNEVDQTDEEGRFVLNEIDPGLGPGPWHLEVRAPGFRTAETGRLQIPEDGEAAPLEIILSRGAALEGRVLDGDGQPVPQAMIDVFAPDSYRLSGPFHWTDDLGRYRIGGLGPGEYRLVAGGSGGRAEGKIVLGDSGTYRLDLRVPFPSGVEVSGRVVDEEGEPVPGVRLSLLTFEKGRPRPSARSTADGSFRFQNVPDGAYRLLGSAPAFLGPIMADEVLVASQEIGGLVLRLKRGGTITGRVLGISDMDWRLLRIEARRDEGGTLSVMMHRDTYRLPVAPGIWRVTASFPSGLAATGTVEVGAGEEAVLDLEMPRGLTLSGQVLVDGQPLAEAEISVSPFPAPVERYQPSRATTRYDGSFSVPGLLPGRVTLTVTSRGIDHAQHLDLTTDRTITIEISTEVTPGGTAQTRVVLKPQ